MKRDLFVFCGQSNMQGCGGPAPKQALNITHSLEFKYSQKYRNRGEAGFVPVTFDTGKWLYLDNAAAYPNGEEKSRLAQLWPNALFLPAMSSFDDKLWPTYSEATSLPGCAMVPYFCQEYEKLGQQPLACHIAKGATRIIHYFSPEMAQGCNEKIGEYNATHGTQYPPVALTEMEI